MMNLDFNDIIEVDNEDFDIRQILDCGQIFRYEKENEGYYVYSLDKRCYVKKRKDRHQIFTNDKEYFYNYFDLDRDYTKIKQSLKDKPFMNKALEYGSGIRILNQDKWEMLISFITSANNHIPRIKKLINSLCEGLGENMGSFKAFPTPFSMASKNELYYANMGFGYRAKYLVKTAQDVANGFDLELVNKMNEKEGREYLQRLLGVGEKVADCILLFGYHKEDVFPVDTWIRKVYKDITDTQNNNSRLIREKLLEIYGEDLAGYAQQYLFFYKRDTSR